ncbi:MAG: zf-HC2 domain-containing protein [Elusimicrobia bacterium]|nr:zf-HC2 domain-containing protein [Elusimicrobiota bacterium]
MTESDCPRRDLLSAYVDREANPSEERRVDLHLADCAACRAQVRSLGRLKAAVRNQPVPPMPADLRESLMAMARAAQRRADGGFAARLSAAWREALDASARAAAALRARPAWGAALAALLLTVAWGGWQLNRRTFVPVDLILAAHNQYARTMPLASTEKIMSEMPVQITYAETEEAGEVY